MKYCVIILLFFCLTSLPALERSYRAVISAKMKPFSETATISRKITLDPSIRKQGYSLQKYQISVSKGVTVIKRNLTADRLEFTCRVSKAFLDTLDVKITALLTAVCENKLPESVSVTELALGWMDPGQSRKFSVVPGYVVDSVLVTWSDAGGDAVGKLTIGGECFGEKEIPGSYSGSKARFSVKKSFHPENISGDLSIRFDKARVHSLEIIYQDQDKLCEELLKKSPQYQIAASALPVQRYLPQQQIHPAVFTPAEPLEIDENAVSEYMKRFPFFPVNEIYPGDLSMEMPDIPIPSDFTPPGPVVLFSASENDSESNSMVNFYPLPADREADIPVFSNGAFSCRGQPDRVTIPAMLPEGVFQPQQSSVLPEYPQEIMQKFVSENITHISIPGGIIPAVSSQPSETPKVISVSPQSLDNVMDSGFVCE